MSSCILLGDGIAKTLAPFLKACTIAAHFGATSGQILEIAPAGPYDVAVISSGTNDPDDMPTDVNVQATREWVHATRYVWILPAPQRPRTTVSLVAYANHDAVVTFTPGVDGLRPKNSRALAKAIKAKIGAVR